MLLMVTVIHGKSVHGNFERTNDKINNNTLSLHHSKIDCSNTPELFNGSIHPFIEGFPWAGKNVTGSFNDALDAINHACDISDRIHARSRYYGIQDYCLMTRSEYGHVAGDFIAFRFLCHHQPRDKNLLHSLQCLHDHRLLTMLYFHIGIQYSIGILDRISRRNKMYFGTV